MNERKLSEKNSLVVKYTHIKSNENPNVLHGGSKDLYSIPSKEKIKLQYRKICIQKRLRKDILLYITLHSLISLSLFTVKTLMTLFVNLYTSVINFHP